mmetsp:Transcript_94295/g.275759  ORF Transcript_94295/g.275759 Transcript_94295/m.275759 type:complete len:237 (+) Transcript_94295:1064-1774(+)
MIVFTASSMMTSLKKVKLIRSLPRSKQSCSLMLCMPFFASARAFFDSFDSSASPEGSGPSSCAQLQSPFILAARLQKQGTRTMRRTMSKQAIRSSTSIHSNTRIQAEWSMNCLSMEFKCPESISDQRERPSSCAGTALTSTGAELAPTSGSNTATLVDEAPIVSGPGHPYPLSSGGFPPCVCSKWSLHTARIASRSKRQRQEQAVMATTGRKGRSSRASKPCQITMPDRRHEANRT